MTRRRTQPPSAASMAVADAIGQREADGIRFETQRTAWPSSSPASSLPPCVFCGRIELDIGDALFSVEVVPLHFLALDKLSTSEVNLSPRLVTNPSCRCFILSLPGLCPEQHDSSRLLKLIVPRGHNAPSLEMLQRIINSTADHE
ncbi:unnamed protein product [Aphanomyces euteiches]|nr:hypothetical protein Ae201684P_002028 [Aphanomyces euteiches]